MKKKKNVAHFCAPIRFYDFFKILNWMTDVELYDHVARPTFLE